MGMNIARNEWNRLAEQAVANLRFTYTKSTSEGARLRNMSGWSDRDNRDYAKAAAAVTRTEWNTTVEFNETDLLEAIHVDCEFPSCKSKKAAEQQAEGNRAMLVDMVKDSYFEAVIDRPADNSALFAWVTG